MGAQHSEKFPLSSSLSLIGGSSIPRFQLVGPLARISLRAIRLELPFAGKPMVSSSL